MIVADTSAWVEFLRGTSHPAGRKLARLVQSDADIGVTEIVVMEVLAGARSETHLADLRSRLVAFPMVRLEGLADFEEAAIIYRACRAAGATLPGLSDCLIAVPVIRAGATLLHNDADFNVIAKHAPLKIEPLRS